MSTIRVKKFAPASIKEHRITFLIGKRHTGKTSLMIDVLSKIPKPDYILGFSPTDDTLETFKKFMPMSSIFSKFCNSKLELLLSLQRETIRRGKTRSVLLVLDDCLYQKGVLKSTAIRDLFFNGRHLNVGLICAAQYMMDISPELRTNIDYLFCMRENTISNRQKLHKFFFGQFSKFDEFDRVMIACTQNYSALVMDSTVSSTKVDDCIFWYRAVTDVPQFRLGKSTMWRLAEMHMKSDDDIRRAQRLQFQMETNLSNDGSEGGAGGGRPEFFIQKADERGNVLEGDQH